jgi:hypothetical protein
MTMSNDEFEITPEMADAINSCLQIPMGPMQLLTLRQGLCLEIRVPGARLTAKTHKCTTICRRRYFIKGKAVKQLATLETILQMVGLIEQGDVNTTFDNGVLRILTREEKAQLDAQRKEAAA